MAVVRSTRTLEKGYRWATLKGGRQAHIVNDERKALCGYRGRRPFDTAGWLPAAVCASCWAKYEAAPELGPRRYRVELTVACERRASVEVTALNADEAEGEVRRRYNLGELDTLAWGHVDTLKGRGERGPARTKARQVEEPELSRG